MEKLSRPALILTLLLAGCAQRRPGGGGAAELEAADRLFDAGKFPDARSAYEAGLKADPGNFRPWLKLGHIALLFNSFAEAERRLSEAARLNPEDPELKKLL